jgi:hypothetical protein
MHSTALPNCRLSKTRVGYVIGRGLPHIRVRRCCMFGSSLLFGLSLLFVVNRRQRERINDKREHHFTQD